MGASSSLSMRILLLFLLTVPFLQAEEAPAPAEPGKPPAPRLSVVIDRDLYAVLPDTHLFENISAKLFRSGDGTKLFVGPAEENQFYIVEGRERIQKVMAPSTGKAYRDKTGRFALWYDTLKDGVHFEDGYILRFSQPSKSRFGVSYDAEYFYLYDGEKSSVYARKAPARPLFTLEGHYVYKIAGTREALYVFCFRTLKSESTRSHLVLVYREEDQKYVEMKRYDLPDYLSVLDVDPFDKKVLLLNDSEMAPQVLEFDLRRETWKNYGIVDYFALYLDPGFLSPPSASRDPDESKSSPPTANP